ncbi:50S ribosomal protein L21e [Candidatus Bathyarchaeota archaeon]|nr:50S ribosomal protein L21e [Candidatus Bathyarchaeota archaeon]RJS69938.1 MAG: 50S ribosomal protein L21e [Candidatus Bathyarchaeota archaeon]RLI12362.1 MAG: 50S ribosomal protein L21e [Candidatus Bathyarchaeota archaeon]RLI14612.1 MAG: 50S ribosomal protein L21e [Candidatus Bathyarchaeota archaeon]RLI21576.1 MAG: 50S ribosomal protein L21e [Candidatus Bathyarchaeota archaeon]
MKKSKGYRTRTRRLLKKKPREKGKLRMSKLLHQYQPGNHVVVKIDPSVHKGMPHKRYHGKVGTIIDKRGRSYIVSVRQGDAVKEIIVRPEHLEPYKE